MLIRHYQPSDYEAVYDLLVECNVETPVERSDYEGGLGLVAEDEGRIVGCIWALVGPSTQAHGDWLAVKKEYRAAQLGFALMLHLDVELKKRGVKRYTFYVVNESNEFIDIIIKYGKSHGVSLLGRGEICLFRREIGP